MGIIILVVLAVGAFTVLHAAFRFIKVRIQGFNVRTATAKASIQPVSDESSWATLEVPAFIRRGLQYPVLTEKPKKRTRKAKVAMAVA